MRDRLTPQEIADYRENGFLVIPDFLSAGEVAELEEMLADAVAHRDGRPLPLELDAYPIGKQFEEGGWKNVLSQHLNLWQTHPRVRALTLDERLGRIACDLEGIDAVRIWHDQMMVKPPWGSPTGWHVDTPVFPFTSDHAISFWFALADATLLNGCLHYVPGSHRARCNVKVAPRLDGLADLDPEWARTDPVPCPVARGGMIAHNGYTAHGANGNITPQPRPTFAVTFMPDGVRFNGTQNILSHGQLAQLAIGDPLDDDDTNPVVYSRAREAAPTG